MNVKYLFTILLFFVASDLIFTQGFYPPLKGNEPDIKNKSIQETIQILDEYWENIPDEQKMAKGSGYKVYQRWKYLREMEIKPDGSLMTAADFRKYKEQHVTFNTNTVEWETIGPFVHEYSENYNSKGIGRVNVVAVDPEDSNIYYVGAPAGGLWKTTDDGQTWTILTNDLPTMGVSGIAIDANDNKIIYIATGDEDGNDSVGMGVYKSIDGGDTWENIGLQSTDWCGDIYIHPDNSECLYVCTSNGLFKTLDGGTTWVSIVGGEAREFRFKPDEPSVFYVALNRYGDWELRKYTNDGADFSILYEYTDGSRMAFDIAPSNANYIYILRARNTYNGEDRLLKSTDGGDTFIEVNNSDAWPSIGNQSYYNWAIAVSETDPNIVIVGAVRAYKSIDGGESFLYTYLGPSWTDYLHADIHYIKFANGRVFIATDGGLGVSDDVAETMVDKSFGLGIGQFYRVDVAEEPGLKISGGLQDNGGFAYQNETWTNYGGADGMDCAIDPTDPDKSYYLTQWGGRLFGYSFNENVTSYSGYGAVAGSGSWITPLEFANDGTLYAGFWGGVYTYNGYSWSDYNTEINWSIRQLKVNPFNSEELLVIAYGGVLFRVTATSVHEIEVPAGSSSDNEVTNIAYNQNIAGTIYLTTKDDIYMSDDAGATLTNITLGLEPAGNFVDIIHHEGSPNNSLYVIATRGVYYKDDTMGEWMSINDGLPSVHLTDIEVNSVENYLVLATYGRGVFRASAPSVSLDVIDLTKDNDAIIYPNPTADAIMLKKPINEKLVVSVTSIDGKLVKQQVYNQFTVDDEVSLLGMKAGTYIVTFKSERHLITKKVIKQ